ncbi:MAG TPA: SRPBCC family protein [Caulobacteraceae bacterium]|nr:SRPBCC family protein [Caulobacteraceae bacterium]
MTIAPIVVSVRVAAPPDRAFTMFSRDMGRWWPRGRTIGAKPHAEIIVEPRNGGRWFERDETGVETHWGKVLAWEPPGRLLLGWQLDSQFTYDPALLTEVELTFASDGEGGSTVTLEHRNLERFGVDAEKVAGRIGEGWPRIIGHFADFAGVPSAV